MTFTKKTVACLIILLMVFTLMAPSGMAKEKKIGYVDLRRAFYEYEKTKTLETELTALTEESQEKRNDLIKVITQLRDEAELGSAKVKVKKQGEIDAKLGELQEFDRGMRQTLLNKKNDMFRQVVDDIQAIVKEMGKDNKYDYILDSRNIMYANESYDLTDNVLKELNKK